MEVTSVDKLSEQYIKLRTEREILKEKFNATDGELTAQMDAIESQLLDVLNAAQTSSMSTDSAVVMRRVTKRYNPTNWDAVYQLVHKHKAYGLLFKRVHDANMSTFLEEHPDEYPAGLNVDSRYTVVVRRKSSV
jgi:hypothetical protein